MSSIMAKWFLRKLFYNVNGTLIWATLAEKSKVILDLWNLFIAIVLLGLNIPSENNHFGINSIQKINF